MSVLPDGEYRGVGYASLLLIAQKVEAARRSSGWSAGRHTKEPLRISNLHNTHIDQYHYFTAAVSEPRPPKRELVLSPPP